jgi:hypothetical protein
MTTKDAKTIHGEMLVLRREFEACRQHSRERTDHLTSLIAQYRNEVVGLGQTATDIAAETKKDLTAVIEEVRRDVAALLVLLGQNGHA